MASPQGVLSREKPWLGLLPTRSVGKNPPRPRAVRTQTLTAWLTTVKNGRHTRRDACTDFVVTARPPLKGPEGRCVDCRRRRTSALYEEGRSLPSKPNPRGGAP